MCGIFGYAGEAGGLDRHTLERCRDALAHRGPDAASIWISEDGRVAFSHRRLAIVDLSDAGAQPMHWSNPVLSIVFNGEIYNHADLRAELHALGYRFRGHSDTEVILAGYACWAEGVFSRLRGMFAIAIYDGSSNRLLLARDRAGEKPLYWTRHRGGVLFASELTAFFADKTFARHLDLAGLNSYLAFGYVSGEQCLVAGVSKVLPAHILKFDLKTGQVERSCYWNLPEALPDHITDEGALVDEAHNLLKSAVREQLQADVPVAVLLSGGIDSSLVTACAAAETSGSVRTFSVGFPNQGSFDEREHARRISKHFGTEHVEIEIEESSLELIPALAHHFDEPIADSSMIPSFLLSKCVSHHGKAVLGGDGGDELFGGYRAYQGALRLEAIRSFLPFWARSGIAAAGRALLPIGYKGRNAIANLDRSMAEGVAKIGIMFDAGLRSELVPALKAKEIELPERWKRSLVDQQRGVPGAFMASDFRSYMVGDILVKVDRSSMANSLEVRSPFLDHRIVEFAFSRVPNCFRASVTERKIVLRRMAERLLPGDFDFSRKQGFSIPLSAWLTPNVREAAFDHVHSTRFSKLFDFSAIKRLLSYQHVGAVNRIFSLLLLMHWMEAHDVDL